MACEGKEGAWGGYECVLRNLHLHMHFNPPTNTFSLALASNHTQTCTTTSPNFMTDQIRLVGVTFLKKGPLSRFQSEMTLGVSGSKRWTVDHVHTRRENLPTIFFWSTMESSQPVNPESVTQGGRDGRGPTRGDSTFPAWLVDLGAWLN